MLGDLTHKVSWAIETIPGDPDLDKGINDVDLAKVLGTNKNTLAAYRRGEGLLKGEVIERLVSHYHFNPMWLFKGEGEPFPGARAKYKEVCGPEHPSCQPIVGYPDFPADDFVLIPQMTGFISAGIGLMPDNNVEVRVAFRRDWMARKGRADNMSLIKVEGDSMEPTLLSGDLVLVDHSKNEIAGRGGIYAISIDSEILIKRVQPVFSNGKLRVISDNKVYDAFEVPTESVRVNGRVIWFARDMERSL